MKKTAQEAILYLPMICLVLGLMIASGKAVAVECGWSPLTKLEASICGDPALKALDRELTAAIVRARNRVDQGEERSIRDGIARKCRRDSEVTLEICLLNAELDAFEQLAIRLGEFRPSQLHRPLKRKQLEKLHLLQRQLTVARSSLRATENPHLTVTTIVELINVAKQRRSHSNGNMIERLQEQLADGCSHPQYAARWRTAVVANGMLCSNLNQQAPIYSFSDFD